jgi:MFS family permease
VTRALSSRRQRSADVPPLAAFGWRWITPLVLGVSLNSVNSSLIATALFPIARSLNVDVSATTVLVAALYIVSAVAQPALGRLADEIGPRPVFLAGVGLVSIAGLLGAVSATLGQLVVSRVLLGVGTSACYPAAIVMVRRRADRDGLALPNRLLGWLSISGQLSAALGLPLGGVLVSLFGWRSTFAINVPLALVTLVLTVWWIPREPADGARRAGRVLLARLDLPGVVLFWAAMVGLFETVRRVTVGVPALLVVGSVFATLAFVAWELTTATPLVDIRALTANAALTMTYMRSCATFIVVYGVLYGVTQWLQAGRHLSATTAAMVLLPMSVVSACVSYPMARSTRLRWPLIASSAIFAAVLAGLLLTGATSSLAWVVVVVSAFGVAIGLSVIANQAALYVQAAADEIGAASGLLRCANYVGAILSSALITITYGRFGVTDTGLHWLAGMLLGVGAVVLVAVLADRSLSRNAVPRQLRRS